MTALKLGDRVSWFASRRHVGSILELDRTVASGYVRGDDGTWREVGPRVPAALVLCDTPKGALEHADVTVRVDRLTILEVSRDELARELGALTIEDRVARLCACHACRHPIERPPRPRWFGSNSGG